MPTYVVPKGHNVSWNKLPHYYLSIVRGAVGGRLRLLMVFLAAGFLVLDLSASDGGFDLLSIPFEDDAIMFLDSVPAPARTTSSKEPFQEASRSEKARAAIILKHTRLGTPPPSPEELERQRQERIQKTEDRLAKQRALVADRLERRRQRLEALKKGGIMVPKSISESWLVN